MEALLAITEGDDLQACHKLKQALRLTNQTGMIGNFLIDGSKIGHLLEKLVHKGELGDLERHRAHLLLKEISTTSAADPFILMKSLSKSW